VRGKKSADATALGGKTSTQLKLQQRADVIREMQSLVNNEHSVSMAADFVFRTLRLGTSKDANLKIWRRHGPK
jgi:hypothetical protein